MAFKSFGSGSPGESDLAAARGPAAEHLAPRDVISMLELMAELACQRQDSRRWRLALLESLTRILPAASAVAGIVVIDPVSKSLELESAYGAGFKFHPQHAAFLNEFNSPAFGDPFARLFRESAAGDGGDTFTALRRELVEDAAWNSSSAIQQYRQAAQIDDCVLSVHRPGIGETHGVMRLMVLLAFRKWSDAARFAARECVLLNTLHAGLSWMYRTEETRRATRAAVLSPRLRETLDYILAGDTERKVASKMAISIHTVHDYVKALYIHFGVSSRGELMARFIKVEGAGERVARKSGHASH